MTDKNIYKIIEAHRNGRAIGCIFYPEEETTPSRPKTLKQLMSWLPSRYGKEKWFIDGVELVDNVSLELLPTIGSVITVENDPANQEFMVLGHTKEGHLLALPSAAIKIVDPKQIIIKE